VADRLALQPGCVRQQPPDRERPVARRRDVLPERIVERDPALGDQRHDRSGRERLRDRADPVLRVRSRLASALRIRDADRQLEHPLAANDDGSGEARKTVLGLRCPDEPGEVVRAHSGSRLRRHGALGECETRTQGVLVPGGYGRD
jgi:hypothetical protein